MPRFRIEDLRVLGRQVLQAAGATDEEAGLVVGHAIASMLSGEENHGLQPGLQYIQAIKDGTLKPGSPITVIKETPTTLMVDGNFNFGHYVSHHVMLRLIEKARVNFVAAGSIRYQCHVGRLADYTTMAAKEGMIALMMTDGAWGTKFVAPWGGREPRLGVNPFSMALPSDLEGTVCFDMTAGSVSMGKVARAREQGERIPEGWLIDKAGKPTTDPNAFFEGGSVLPMGGVVGHKGYAITFFIEALADILSGMEWEEDATRPWPIVDGAFIAVFNVEAFRSLIDFKRDMKSFAEHVKSSAPAEGSPGVFYPGERSYLNSVKRLQEGLTIPDWAWQRVVALTKEYEREQYLPNPIEP